MAPLPVEVIGMILSRLGDARNVVIAATTCRKWREAWRNHLHTLSFDSNVWPGYRDLTTSRLEVLITEMIFQTKGLECLSIIMRDDNGNREFSAALVIAWVMYTRDTLRLLSLNFETTSELNILEKCYGRKLQVLELAHFTISGVKPSYHKFPFLTSLSLDSISISLSDLSLLLAACPKIENLVLDFADIIMSDDADATVEFFISIPSLKNIEVEEMRLHKFTLEAAKLENLYLNGCKLEHFEFIGKGTLTTLMVSGSNFVHFDIGDSTENLDVVDVSFTSMWPKFHKMISRSSKLRRLILLGVEFDNEDEVVDLERISVWFLHLTPTSFSSQLRMEGCHHCSLDIASQLGNAVILELGWTTVRHVHKHWVARLLKRCTNLTKLFIYDAVSWTRTDDECRMLEDFTSSVVGLVRNHVHGEIQFLCE